MKQVFARIAVIVLSVFQMCIGIAWSQTTTTELFPLTGWECWGGLTALAVSKVSSVTFNGKFQQAAGYVIERNLPFGGMILKLNISNSARSSFDHSKLFKIEANDQPLRPIERSRVNLNDQAYINSGDGSVSFILPTPLKKLQFVFWNASVNELKISGTLGPVKK